MKSSWMRNGLIYVLILVGASVLTYQLFSASVKPTSLPLDQAITMTQQGDITDITLKSDTMALTDKAGTEYTTNIGNLTLLELKELGLSLTGVDYHVELSGFDWAGMLLGWLLPLALIGIMVLFLFRSARGANNQALSFGRSRARLFPASTSTASTATGSRIFLYSIRPL